jgi:hypothetical protein
MFAYIRWLADSRAAAKHHWLMLLNSSNNIIRETPAKWLWKHYKYLCSCELSLDNTNNPWHSKISLHLWNISKTTSYLIFPIQLPHPPYSSCFIKGPHGPMCFNDPVDVVPHVVEYCTISFNLSVMHYTVFKIGWNVTLVACHPACGQIQASGYVTILSEIGDFGQNF